MPRSHLKPEEPNFSYGGGIAGQISLVKLGSNMLTLTGNNSYSGNTAINGGVLAMSNAPNSTPGSILINAGGALSVSGPYNTVSGWLNSGLISQSSAGALALTGLSNETVTMGSYSNLSLGAVPAGATYSGSLTPANNTYRLGGGGALTVSTALTGSNSLVVNGNVNLTGNNSYSGSTTINAGMLAMSSTPNNTANSILINAGGALSASGPYTAGGWLNSGLINTSSSGALALPGSSTDNESINFGSYGGLSLGAAPGGATFSGSINQGNNGVLLGGGGGPLTLTTAFGNDTVTIVGGLVIFTANDTSNNPTYVNAGTLEATTPSALPTQWFGSTNGILVASGAVLAVQAKTTHAPNGWASSDINTLFNNSPGLTQFAPGSSFGIDVVSSDTFTQNGNFPYGSGVSLVKLGGGTLLLSNTTYAATTTISAGTLQLGDGSSNNGSLDGGAGPGTGRIVDNAALVFANPSAQTYSGNINGSGSLIKTSNGTLLLTGDNTYSGGTFVDEGMLEVMASDAIPYGSGLTVGSGGTVVFSDPPEAGATMVARSLPAASPAGAAAVPEPGTLALLGVALWSAAIYRRFRRPKAFVVR